MNGTTLLIHNHARRGGGVLALESIINMHGETTSYNNIMETKKSIMEVVPKILKVISSFKILTALSLVMKHNGMMETFINQFTQ